MQMGTFMRAYGRLASARVLAGIGGRIRMSMTENGKLVGCMEREP